MIGEIFSRNTLFTKKNAQESPNLTKIHEVYLAFFSEYFIFFQSFQFSHSAGFNTHNAGLGLDLQLRELLKGSLQNLYCTGFFAGTANFFHGVGYLSNLRKLLKSLISMLNT
jgi:hypothetical protein